MRTVLNNLLKDTELPNCGGGNLEKKKKLPVLCENGIGPTKKKPT